MKATVYLSRKLLNQLKVKETESKDLMLTHNRHQKSDSNSICCGSCSAHCYERLCNCGEHYL